MVDVTRPDLLIGKDEKRFGQRILAPLLVVLAIVLAGVTFAILSGSTAIIPTREVVIRLVGANAVAVTILVTLIAFQLRQIAKARKEGRAGARLHTRILALFSLIAAVPAVLVAVVATLTLDRGLDRWFSERTQSMVEFSQVVARAYLDEYRQVLNAELPAVASELGRSKPLFDFDPRRFEAHMSNLAAVRSIPYMSIVGSDGTEILRAETRFADGFRQPDPSMLARVTGDEPVLIPPGTTNQIAGLVRLPEFTETYLFLARAVDPRVVQYLLVTEQNAAEFQAMQDRRFGVQLSFGFMFLGLALIMVLSAMWLAINFADRLVLPVRRLMIAAQQISSGNLYVQVPVKKEEGDLAVLGESFNRMTNDLRSQRNALVDAKDQIDGRRRFTEAVLEGVSAGVIGIDPSLRITLVNKSACVLLQAREADLLGRPIATAMPEFSSLFSDHIRQEDGRRTEREVRLERQGVQRILTVKVTVETTDAGVVEGAVLTFDDVSNLVAAQRSSAWADIARRIAHEIKNPLTPIQLSAERLKRRYGQKLTDDRDIFDQCTDTIIRQVGDIGKMVDEFSSFARMPKPEFARGDLAHVIADTVFLMDNGYPQISFNADMPESGLPMMIDTRLMGQVFTNLLKNAAEGVETRLAQDDKGDKNGHVHVSAYIASNGALVIDIADNGIGFPENGRSRLLEPYMTTREKGTGLGLAIVKRIVEDHRGTLQLLDGKDAQLPSKGALVRLIFEEGVLLLANDVDAATLANHTGLRTIQSIGNYVETDNNADAAQAASAKGAH
ncbi:MAG: PAS domain-containing sensor histidine kinase [Pseudomonadota bacterium]